jgi:hypothetical protein
MNARSNFLAFNASTLVSIVLTDPELTCSRIYGMKKNEKRGEEGEGLYLLCFLLFHTLELLCGGSCFDFFLLYLFVLNFALYKQSGKRTNNSGIIIYPSL